MPPTPFEAAWQAVQSLVADFQAHESTYLAPAYQEAEVRKDFIDKLFIALGWDVNHERSANSLVGQRMQLYSSVQMN